jgi:hypothetical protein
MAGTASSQQSMHSNRYSQRSSFHTQAPGHSSQGMLSQSSIGGALQTQSQSSVIGGGLIGSVHDLALSQDSYAHDDYKSQSDVLSQDGFHSQGFTQY